VTPEKITAEVQPFGAFDYTSGSKAYTFRLTTTKTLQEAFGNPAKFLEDFAVHAAESRSWLWFEHEHRKKAGDAYADAVFQDLILAGRSLEHYALLVLKMVAFVVDGGVGIGESVASSEGKFHPF
jgi:hypothetical protein